MLHLQIALDIMHDIRENYPHLNLFLCDTDKTFRDGSTGYFIGVFQGSYTDNKRTCTLSFEYDYTRFIHMLHMFTNQ